MSIDERLMGKFVLNQLERDLGVSPAAGSTTVARPFTASRSAKSVADDEFDTMSLVAALHWLTPPRRDAGRKTAVIHRGAASLNGTEPHSAKTGQLMMAAERLFASV